MILRAFYDFLTSDVELNDPVREGGRQRLREFVGTEIYHGRRPRPTGPVALRLTRSGGVVYSAIVGPVPVEAAIVHLHVYARDDEGRQMSASEVIEEVWDALRDLLPQYRGPMGDRQIQTVNQESEPGEFDVEPEDARDNWTYHYTTSYMIGAERIVPTGAN